LSRLRDILAASGAELEAGALIVVEDHRHRVRPLPIAGPDS
jgi:hypothetical protein